VKTIGKTRIIAVTGSVGDREVRAGRANDRKVPARHHADNKTEVSMRISVLTAGLIAALAAAAAPATAQQSVKGPEAVAIVQGGQVRAASSQGFQGFLLLIEYQGKNYTCTVTAAGQVQTCYPLYW
jgi:hypothetical protein